MSLRYLLAEDVAFLGPDLEAAFLDDQEATHAAIDFAHSVVMGTGCRHTVDEGGCIFVDGCGCRRVFFEAMGHALHAYWRDAWANGFVDIDDALDANTLSAHLQQHPLAPVETNPFK